MGGTVGSVRTEPWCIWIAPFRTGLADTCTGGAPSGLLLGANNIGHVVRCAGESLTTSTPRARREPCSPRPPIVSPAHLDAGRVC
jgi:hypothetical protein